MCSNTRCPICSCTWVRFHNLAHLLSQFFQIPISLGRIEQTLGQSESTQPMCTSKWDTLYALKDETGRALNQRYQESWSLAMLVFCSTDFWTSLAYESADQKPKHCLTPRFLIPLPLTQIVFFFRLSSRTRSRQRCCRSCSTARRTGSRSPSSSEPGRSRGASSS